MKEATGVKKVNPNRLTTQRQVDHMADTIRQKEQERMRKEEYRRYLEQQAADNKFRQERERLYLDEKALATSKAMMQQLDFNPLAKRRVDDLKDLTAIAEDDQALDREVLRLQSLV